MQICTGTGKYGSTGRHDEIITGDNLGCPLCDALETIETLKQEALEANEKLQDLDSTIEDLNAQIKTLSETENVNER